MRLNKLNTTTANLQTSNKLPKSSFTQFVPGRNPSPPVATKLDTLVLPPPSEGKKTGITGKEVLKKRARSKFISNNLALKLADLNSPLRQSYFNTYHCCETLEQVEQKIVGRYCKNRWCLVCNRIRTANQINGYRKPLQDLPDKRFLTLTIPNVSEKELPKAIEEMRDTFVLINRHIREKRKISFAGIRKLEVTYNSERNDYHPHFHCIIQGENVSRLFLDEWLERYPAATRAAQDDRPADDRTIKELFKYFTKIVTKGNIHVAALDVIFRAMYGLRVFQPFGVKKAVVSEDIEELRAEIYQDIVPAETQWVWQDNDWWNESTGESLTGYVPSENVLKLIQNTG